MARKDKFSVITPIVRTHRGKTIRETVSSQQWVDFVNGLDSMPAKVAVIPAGMQGRADLISNSAYGTPDYGWLICAANNILDPFEQLIAGKQIIIPIIF